MTCNATHQIKHKINYRHKINILCLQGIRRKQMICCILPTETCTLPTQHKNTVKQRLSDVRYCLMWRFGRKGSSRQNKAIYTISVCWAGCVNSCVEISFIWCNNSWLDHLLWVSGLFLPIRMWPHPQHYIVHLFGCFLQSPSKGAF